MSTPLPADPNKVSSDYASTDPEKQSDVNGAVPAGSDHSYDDNAEKAANNGEAELEAPPQMKMNPMMDPSSYPDGGRKAWATVAGAFCALFVSFGMCSWGLLS